MFAFGLESSIAMTFPFLLFIIEHCLPAICEWKLKFNDLYGLSNECIILTGPMLYDIMVNM